MEKKIIKFDYDGQPVEFGIGNSVWMNATEIAEKFGKRVSNWTRLDSTKEYIKALADRYSDLSNGFIMVRQGGSMQGTWIHEKLAIEFARWLNPSFAVWCDEKIEELLTTGKTELKAEQPLPDLPKNYVEALRRLADSEEARMIAEAQAEENQEKAEIVDLIVETGDNYSMKQAANALGVGRNDFCGWLRDNNYFQCNNEPYQRYLGQSPFFVVKQVIQAGKVRHTPFVTPRGLTYFAKNSSKLDGIRNKSSKTLDTNIIK